MPQEKKRRADRKKAELARENRPVPPPKSNKWTGIIIVVLIVAIMGGVFGGFYYQTNVAPFRKTVMIVDGKSIRMDYYLKRARLAGSGAMGPLSMIADEQLIKQGAARYGINITPIDVDNALREAANSRSGSSDNTSANIAMSDAEFREWYRQTISNSGLSDSEYRDMVGVSLMAMGLQGYLSERTSPNAPQSHVHVIFVVTPEDAQKVLTRLKAGEDFAKVAAEVSLDSSKDSGGDVGWVPRGVLQQGLDYLAFNLNVGDISDPLPIDNGDQENPQVQGYYIVKVSERSDNRPLDENSFEMVKNRALVDWLSAEKSSGTHQIKYVGLNGSGFDSETSAWINWQISKK